MRIVLYLVKVVGSYKADGKGSTWEVLDDPVSGLVK